MDMRNYIGPSFIKYQDVVHASREEKVVAVEEGKFDRLDLKFASGDLLSLNRTNARVLAQAYGWETNNWIDKLIELYAGETTYDHQTQQSVLVRPVSPPQPPEATELVTPTPKPAGPKQATPKQDRPDLDDEIPL
jgi:hypothetical protein